MAAVETFPVGWQGIVPFKSAKMVAIATDLILTRLVNMKVSPNCAEVEYPSISLSYFYYNTSIFCQQQLSKKIVYSAPTFRFII